MTLRIEIHGKQGSGKTSLALVLKNLLETEAGISAGLVNPDDTVTNPVRAISNLHRAKVTSVVIDTIETP